MSAYLKPESVADTLDVTVTMVYRLIQNGRLKAVDIGMGKRACWRIRQDDLDEFLQPKNAKPSAVANKIVRRRRRKRLDDGMKRFV